MSQYALTSEKVETCAGAAGFDDHVKKTKGCKNIPMLDAITAQYVHTHTLSLDGTAVPLKWNPPRIHRHQA